MIAAFCNGERISALPLDSRAAHYGDGAFTTIRAHAGRLCNWRLHRQRLHAACLALHLCEPDWLAIESMLERETATLAAGVVKLALVPQAQGRGYARVWPSVCDVYVFAYAAAAVDSATYRDGITLDLSYRDTAGGDISGIKTLSRLDQVLAAPTAAMHDVLICDRDGFICAAQQANVFALFDRHWITPPARQGVIAGVMRAALLQSPPLGFSGRVQVLHRDALIHGVALILCNAVRGIVPVCRLGERIYAQRDGIRALMHVFHPELGLPDA